MALEENPRSTSRAISSSRSDSTPLPNWLNASLIWLSMAGTR